MVEGRYEYLGVACQYFYPEGIDPEAPVGKLRDAMNDVDVAVDGLVQKAEIEAMQPVLNGEMTWTEFFEARDFDMDEYLADRARTKRLDAFLEQDEGFFDVSGVTEFPVFAPDFLGGRLSVEAVNLPALRAAVRSVQFELSLHHNVQGGREKTLLRIGDILKDVPGVRLRAQD